MRIIVDPPKRRANLASHGFDLKDIKPDFFESSLIEVAKKGRFMAIGRLGDRPVALIFQRLGTEAVAAISLRTASMKKRLRYDKSRRGT